MYGVELYAAVWLAVVDEGMSRREAAPRWHILYGRFSAGSSDGGVGSLKHAMKPASVSGDYIQVLVNDMLAMKYAYSA